MSAARLAPTRLLGLLAPSSPRGVLALASRRALAVTMIAAPPSPLPPLGSEMIAKHRALAVMSSTITASATPSTCSSSKKTKPRMRTLSVFAFAARGVFHVAPLATVSVALWSPLT